MSLKLKLDKKGAASVINQISGQNIICHKTCPDMMEIKTFFDYASIFQNSHKVIPSQPVSKNSIFFIIVYMNCAICCYAQRKENFDKRHSDHLFYSFTRGMAESGKPISEIKNNLKN